MEFDRLQLAIHGDELQPSAPTHTPLKCSRTTFNHLSWESVFREVVKRLFTRPEDSSSQCRLVIAWSSWTFPTRSTAFIATPCWMRCGGMYPASTSSVTLPTASRRCLLTKGVQSCHRKALNKAIHWAQCSFAQQFIHC